ncbi:MAG: ABC transporter ATP-binding protein/permease [Methylococcaceae bacterium]|nr:ABC transporter ATP-binding protein/permease [Methylococcaceae bacterium]
MQQPMNFLSKFITLAGPFWNSENKAVIRGQSLTLVALTILQIGLAVVINEWNAALFNALEQRSMPGLLTQISLLALIFMVSMAVTATHLMIKRRLQISWRSWLTTKVTEQWIHKGRHYQVTHIQSAGHDNPDGRIAEDIAIATENAIGLCHSLFYSLLMLISFTQILWTLSGTVTLNLIGVPIPIVGHLVWIAIVYAVSASTLGWWIGQPLTIATNEKQNAEANYRFGLVKVRENSQAIALINGENNEKIRLSGLLNAVVGTFNQQTQAWKQIMLFTSGYSVLSMAFPILLSSPRYILGSITLGALMQSAQAFQQMASALSWPVDNMAGVAQWRASVERVLSLVQALDDLKQEIARPDPQRIVVEKGAFSILSFEHLCIRKLNDDVIAQNINADIKLGERVLILGDAATGAKLFKAIAGLWPWGNGRIVLPDGDPMFFMPPLPYLPDGTLREAICYPAAPAFFNQKLLQQSLKRADLSDLIEQLDQQDTWEKVLSREQQQRLGLVRLLLNRPKWILLQEAFDALDATGEAEMMRMIFEELPDAGVLTVTNHCAPEGECANVHQRQLIL